MKIPTVNSHRIATNRQAFSTKDAAVSAAYGLDDVGHGFSDLGPHFTVSPSAHKEMLQRLLAESHRRAAEEEAAKR